MTNTRKASISAALIVLFCFFMPWIQVSCGAAKDSMAGIDIAREGHNALWLIPVLLIAFLLTAFVGASKARIDFSSLLAFVAGLMSAYLMNRERLRANDASGLLQVRPTGWLWLGLGASITLAVSSAIQFLKRREPS